MMVRRLLLAVTVCQAVDVKKDSPDLTEAKYARSVQQVHVVGVVYVESNRGAPQIDVMLRILTYPLPYIHVHTLTKYPG